MLNLWKAWSFGCRLLSQDGLCLSRQACTAKLATMATTLNACFKQDQPWLADNGATNHVTTSLNQLSFPKPYTTQDHLTVGNGQNLPITYTGTVLIPSSFFDIQLNIVLRVPSIASNLASVHKLCHDNHCWCYFDENIISIQALDIGKILYQGKSEGGVHSINTHHASQLLPLHRICNNVSRYPDFNKTLQHMRLGHPNDQALNCLFPNVKSVQNNVNLVTPTCTYCLYGKMHNISFLNFQFKAFAPFELIHSNLWGPAPTLSVNGLSITSYLLISTLALVGFIC